MKVKKIGNLLFLNIFILCIVLGAGCSTSNFSSSLLSTKTVQEGTIPGFLKYENKSQGISIEFPNDWTKEEGAGGTLVAFKSPTDANDTFLENVNIVTEDVSQAPSITLKDYEKAALDLVIKSASEPDAAIKDVKVKEKKDMKISGLPARFISYTSVYSETGTKLYSRQYFTLKDKTVYIITYTSSQEKPDAFMDVVEKMVNSFKVNK